MFVSRYNTKYIKILKSDKILALDECTVPFDIRLQFREYIPGKRHKHCTINIVSTDNTVTTIFENSASLKSKFWDFIRQRSLFGKSG